MEDLIYEFRSYRLQPGKAPLYLQLLHRGGASIVSRHLPLAGFWMTETGRLNLLHHLWVYESLEDRTARRASLMADKEWTEGFIPEAFPLLLEQESRLTRMMTGSAALEAAVVGMNKPVQPGDGSPLAATLHQLSILRGQPLITADIASFVTISGMKPGSRIAIATHNTALPEEPSDGFELQELMRPAVFSPLR